MIIMPFNKIEVGSSGVGYDFRCLDDCRKLQLGSPLLRESLPAQVQEVHQAAAQVDHAVEAQDGPR